MRLRSVFLCNLALVLSGAVHAAEKRPNIIYIMSDDHAAHAISAYGSKINKTPNIDRLAKEGMRFQNCFVTNSICTPSRAVILTGKYSHLNGVPVFNRFDGSQPTLAKYLQKAGYHTGMIGKWHLGSDPTGFTEWNILPGQGLYHNPVFITSGGRKKHTGYCTDLITDFSLKFLEDRPKDKPFFLMCHHKAPHRAWQPDEKHRKIWENVQVPEPATFNDDYSTRSAAAKEATMRIDQHLTPNDLKQKPPEGLTGQALKKWKYQRYMRDYLACVHSVDDNVGRILDYLQKTGLAENTIVIYTSDQGFFLGDHNWYDKRFMYEECLRMPFLVRWPATIKAGGVSDGMVLNVDFAPTLLDAAGVKVPTDMQGRSFLQMFKGEKPKDWRTSMYYRYYHYPMHHRVQPHYGVRTERYKLIFFNKIKEWELFDLQKDPHELKNVYADPAYAETVKTLKAEMHRLKKELKDEDQFANELPRDNVDARPATPSYRVLGHDKGKVAIVNARGVVQWEYPSRGNGHDLCLLPNGNILLTTSDTTVAEVTPEKKVVWKYEAKPKAGYKGRVEVHAFQRLPDGTTMVAESGNRRIVEVNKEGKVIREVPLIVEKPHPHRDTRMVRKLDNGNYLVCQEGDGKVCEYSPTGKVVWSYKPNLAGRPRSPGHGPEGHGVEVFGALRLPNGNTLIAGGNNNRVIEVTPKGNIVWSIGHNELPGIRLAWVTTLQVLPNGNLIVGNCHAGPDNPQLFEVTRDKKVVWKFNNFKTFGNSLAVAQVLDIKGKVNR